MGGQGGGAFATYPAIYSGWDESTYSFAIMYDPVLRYIVKLWHR